MLKDLVFLTQTDTTIGFVSRNADKLTKIKQRPPHKHYIKALPSLKKFTSLTRIPSVHKNRIRRSKKSTFIMPNSHSYRLVQDQHHLLLLHRLGWAYTTSANLSGEAYNGSFAQEHADVVITPLKEKSSASKIYKLGKNKLKRIR